MRTALLVPRSVPIQDLSRVEQLFGNSATFNFNAYAPIDFFFVDGCHEYEAAKRDTLSAWQALRSGGLLVWHDYTWRSVEEAVSEVCPAEVTWVDGTSIAFARKF